MFVKFKKWLSGDINWKEEKAFRQKVEDDPFLKEAMMGYEQFPTSNHAEKIHQINKRIRQRTSSSRRIPLRAIAATLLFVVSAGLFWLVNQTAFQSTEQGMAQTQAKSAEPAIEMPLVETAPTAFIEEAPTPVNPPKELSTSVNKSSKASKKPSTTSTPAEKHTEFPNEKIANAPTPPLNDNQEKATPPEPMEESEVAKEKMARKIVSRSSSPTESTIQEEAITQESAPQVSEVAIMPMMEEEADGIVLIMDSTDAYSEDAQDAGIISESMDAPISRSVYAPNQQIIQYLQDNLQYPTAAKRNGIKGIVRLQYRVNKRGKLKNIKVLDGLGYGCDEEAIRLLKSVPFLAPTNKMDTLEIKFDY